MRTVDELLEGVEGALIDITALEPPLPRDLDLLLQTATVQLGLASVLIQRDYYHELSKALDKT